MVEIQARSAIAACAEVRSEAPDRGSLGNERRFTLQVARAMRRLGVPTGPVEDE